MIVTVTPNTALDRVLFVPDLAWGQTVRALDAVWGMGGKGAVTSWVLGQLGTPSLALGLAAGETGRRVEDVLRAAGVETDLLWVAGETRTNYVLVREADGAQLTVTTAGLEPTTEDGERLAERVAQRLSPGDYMLCGGTLPKGLAVDWYVPLLHLARERGVVTLLDAASPYLQANIGARPDIVKPNAAEAEALLGWPVVTHDDALRAVREIDAVLAVCLTLGERGAVVRTPDGLYHLPPLSVRVCNSAGAGDGFNAGLLRALAAGAGWEEALRWAVAVATAVLLTPGTGALNPADVEPLYQRARVQRL